MFSELDKFRIETFKTDALDTIIKSEMVDETAFMGHRVMLADTSLKGFTKMSGVTANFDHAERCLRKMVGVYKILTSSAWMESEIVFKDEPISTTAVENTLTNKPVSNQDSLENIIECMMKNGWGYSDQIAFGNGKGFRKFMFVRDDWHGVDLLTAVELSHTAAVDDYDPERFLSKVSELADASVKAWNTMLEAVPTQNLFGAIQVDKAATEYAFGGGIDRRENIELPNSLN